MNKSIIVFAAGCMMLACTGAIAQTDTSGRANQNTSYPRTGTVRDSSKHIDQRNYNQNDSMRMQNKSYNKDRKMEDNKMNMDSSRIYKRYNSSGTPPDSNRMNPINKKDSIR